MGSRRADLDAGQGSQGPRGLFCAGALRETRRGSHNRRHTARVVVGTECPRTTWLDSGLSCSTALIRTYSIGEFRDGSIPMNTKAASAIRSEVQQLVELQIQPFRQESPLADVDLIDFRMRSERIRTLCWELDQIARKRPTWTVWRTSLRVRWRESGWPRKPAKPDERCGI
jgi:hypothetical protein